MIHTRLAKLARTAASIAAAALLVPMLSACPAGDVGAPCNHGDVEPPQAETVTFPALSCNDLLCVYADTNKPSDTPCMDDAACNADQGGVNRFECFNGSCRLNLTYVLERSMCSKSCEVDGDCADGGITDRVLADQSSCNGSFKCVIIQRLGEFCCKPLCVCTDDLNEAVADELDQECQAGAAAACGDDGMEGTQPETGG